VSAQFFWEFLKATSVSGGREIHRVFREHEMESLHSTVCWRVAVYINDKIKVKY